MYSQSLRCIHVRQSLSGFLIRRHFGSAAILKEAAFVPWFLDRPHKDQSFPQHLPPKPETAAPLPEDAPKVIKYLHAKLLQSPHLEKSRLVVSQAVLPDLGPPLPLKKPQGRRRRGGTYAGESGYEAVGGGLWSWVVMSQVKEGTENRGSIESVVRLVRKSLLQHDPPILLPPKSRRTSGNDWRMIDAGSFAIHILSKAAREKYFNTVAHRDW